MNNLLVPTDFSEYADRAFRVAAQIAPKLGAKIHLYHLIEDIEEDEQPDARQGLTDHARQSLEELAGRFPDVNIQAVTQTGSPLNEMIRQYVDEHGIDLIVMGSHGASGKSEYFIGSNTQKVVRTVNTSALVVKKELDQPQFRKVVFASSFNENEKGAFERFKEFVRPFVPEEIHLVAIHTSSFFDAPYTVTKQAMEDFKALCHPFPAKTHVFKDFTVDRGVRRFAAELEAELIGISNHYRHPLRRMLIGSNVEALINHADVPVLSIDYRDSGQKDQDQKSE